MSNAREIVETVFVAASPETVWTFWVDPARMAEWWGPAELEPTPGGVCRVTMSSGQVMEGTYLLLEPYERLMFSFGWSRTSDDHGVPPNSTTVEVTLARRPGGTQVTIRHRGLPESALPLHQSGWSHFAGELGRAASAIA